MRAPSVAAIVFVAGLTGCTVGNRPSGGSCRDDSSCADGLVCVSGMCQSRAGSDSGPAERRDAAICPGGGTTSISGVVRIPAGTLPVPGAVVYVAEGPVAPIPTGVDGRACLRCDAELSGVVGTPVRTGTDGSFTLTDVPAGENIQLVIQIGKWRRITTIPVVEACQSYSISPDSTRLPRNRAEGHLPRFALTTGSCDGMECLLRKLGIDDSEFTMPDRAGRVNLFADRVCVTIPLLGETCESGRNRFDASLGGERFPSAQEWWSRYENLAAYDAVIHSCECSETVANKPEAAREALRRYAEAGGRVFLTHYHYAWLQHAIDPYWRDLARWGGGAQLDTATGRIDTTFERGMLLADWMMLPDVRGSTTYGSVSLREARQSSSSVGMGAQPWIWVESTPVYFSFDAPLHGFETEACGRVVFSDIHVSSADQAQSSPFGGEPPSFPQGCTSTITPQEQALIFMLFDLTNCIGEPVLW